MPAVYAEYLRRADLLGTGQRKAHTLIVLCGGGRRSLNFIMSSVIFSRESICVPEMSSTAPATLHISRTILLHQQQLQILY